MTQATQSIVPLIKMSNISKNFFATQALKNVDFELNEGEVHVLFGENGAGKSTLMSILAGVIKPTSGKIFVNGKSVSFNSVHDSKVCGIGTVFQEFSLVPTLTIAENVYLGDEPLKNAFVDKTKIKEKAIGFFKELGFDVDIHKKVSELPRAEQQMVEIVKAFKANAKVLILDEPTASLTDKEVSKLFDFIRQAIQRGVGVIYISHRIQEFRGIANRITVLRDGQLIDTFLMDKISDKELIECMAGRSISEIYPKILKTKNTSVFLSLKNFKPKGLESVSFEVQSGEILGIAGLVGSGKSRLWRSIMGLHPAEHGSVTIRGEELFNKPTKTLLKKGVFYLPPDRKDEGLQLLSKTDFNIKTNILLRKDVTSKYGFVKQSKQSKIAKKVSKKSDIKSKYFKQLVASLSGGNQQKILFAKGLVSPFDMYILDEPSVGVDVATRAIVYLLIKELTEAGKTVVVISSDLPEVINLSHRVLVFSRGKVVTELKDEEISEKNILKNFF